MTPPRPPAFRPLPWLRHRHAQTIWPAVCRRPPGVTLRPERLELDDGDFLDLFWGPPRSDGPLVLVLHGLGGCASSAYVRGMVAALSARGCQAVIMQYRGAGPPNRLRRFYYAGDTVDPAHVARHVTSRYPGRALHAVGFSLGGNILLNWLASPGCPLTRTVAVSPPFDLAACAEAINHGFARVYQRDLLGGLKRMYRAKFGDRPDAPLPVAEVTALPTLRAFDDAITAPFHGYADVTDYYARASCGQRLPAIRESALILHAEDDPFIPPGVVPAPGQVPPNVDLRVSARGGHVGFVSGRLRPHYWAEATAADFIADVNHTPAYANSPARA